VPFFWSEQYDFGFSYIGNAQGWDQADIDGRLDENTQDCTITYRKAGKQLAVVVVHRDLDGLKAEVAFERTMAAAT
jgi:apoptosis-inducing factor 3